MLPQGCDWGGAGDAEAAGRPHAVPGAGRWGVESERREEWRMTDNDFEVSFGDDVNVLKLDSGYGCTTL